MIAAIRRTLACRRFGKFSSPPKPHSIFPLHFSTLVHPTVYELLVHNHHFSPKSASEIASVVTHLRKPEKFNATISFFKGMGFSDPQLEKMLKCRPQLLCASLEKTIKPRIKIFRDLGLSTSDVAEIFANHPWIFVASIDKRIIPCLSALMSVLEPKELAEIMKPSTIFLRPYLYNNLIPNVELLKKCGVSMDQIVWMMLRFPRFMGGKLEDTKKSVDKADKIGASATSKKYIHGVRIFSSMSDKTWEAKMRTLKELGFSSEDIAAAFRKCPWVFSFSAGTWVVKIRTLKEVGFSDGDITEVFRKFTAVFCLSPEKVKMVKDVLLANGKYDVCSIVGMPLCLTMSIEKRYKPRLKVLELLESKGLIQSWPAFTTFCVTSNRNFYKKYVVPFADELGDVCVAKWAAVANKQKNHLI